MKYALIAVFLAAFLIDFSYGQVNEKDSLALVALYNSTDGSKHEDHFLVIDNASLQLRPASDEGIST